MARISTDVQADIDNLRRAIGTGARRVEFGSGVTRHITEFRSLADMQSTLAVLQAELSGLAGATAPSRVAYLEHGRD
jgi:hypothetical protein